MKKLYGEKIKAVVFDWAGTTVDYGCFAPLNVFIEIFKRRGIDVTMEEARKPMGKLKIDHIREMCEMDRIKNIWVENFGGFPTEEDVNKLYAEFEPMLFETLEEYTTPIPHVVETIEKLRKNGLKIGSTTGYTREMMNIVEPNAAKKGYSPDFLVTPSEVSQGRPYPWMCYKNAEALGVSPMSAMVKVGDTLSDVKEGINAGMWSVAVIKGSSELGLTQEEVENMDKEELKIKMEAVSKKFKEAGAHFVIETMAELEDVLVKIENETIKSDFVPENDYILLTPGPLSTTKSVRASMLKDLCTWDVEYNDLVQDVRRRLVSLATKNTEKYTSVLMQGSGTFSVEATIGSTIPKNGKLLVIANGAYGKRMKDICSYLNIEYVDCTFSDVEAVDLNRVENLLKENKDITHISMVHCETTTGRLNPIKDVGKLAKEYNKVYIVDAMSSFGGIEIDVEDFNIDFLVSSSNKCIQGVPGFGFIIANRDELAKCKGIAKSLSLDVYAQWETMENNNGKWRFTSPTHVVRAFYQALLELEEEGSVEKRYARYKENQFTISSRLKSLGFDTLVNDDAQSPVITTFLYPKNAKFEFMEFYTYLKENGFVIYPGKLTDIDTFRIGSIGEVYPKDMDRLADVIEKFINM
ncbi:MULTISPECIES: 2-aminoethylphosphonate--pyruvate transaminase [unclassified Clostridioides]|uniref:2-aminoethylphosphonate--pyruvate transaminase n=1 Tax=unclassified Clostridioides TaxID=2635829 RepID=UPI001D1132D0|nr:2-aminoethylphosphonate--pyruvate transaminase [Clostridioides sp. ZZV14-6150]MCC0721440.1 2-aminoethylphosphonate--pyruvate transaminase [Clostridioides sp. ZZV14-6104]MCC0727921.1 2-aminoethylphosphonate--pyruvate transaminase [Clostridioides sp. ZZV14-6045]MCC0734377.1 2-aminoethylphosphonate--pyruvate transaminase [Clostridioides sp. ZZV14-6009]MCC0741950.1 2-aminoethylphosphonate--pyruvate transaminase [Clostridioides sp. ZZV14-6044]MCC0749711.1 2-aminoethylphosphonate--pyruvate transa